LLTANRRRRTRSEELDSATSVLLKELLTRDQWRAYQAGLEQQARAPFVARVDDEQVDIAASSAEMRATLADSPLRPMPLFVMTHGVPDPPSPGEPLEFAQAKERVWQDCNSSSLGSSRTQSTSS
jgi:hypothetical protein